MIQVINKDGKVVTEAEVDTSLLATSANQTIEITNLSNIDGKIPSGLTVVGSRLQVELPSSGGLTDTELRASPVPVSVSGIVSVDTTGLATEAKQDTGNSSLSTIAGAVSGSEMQVDIVNTPTVELGATSLAALENISVTIPGTVDLGTISLTALETITVEDGGGSLTVDANNLDIRDLAFATDKVDVSGSSGVGVTGIFWQATQPISAAALPLPSGAAIAANQQTDALTDAELRATPVPISGTITANTGLSQPLTDAQLRATPVPISGTVSVSTIGLATDTKQDTQTALLTTIDGDTSNLDVALSTRLKPADTLAGVTTVGAVTQITNALPAGTNNIGDVDVLTLPSIPAGTNTIGNVKLTDGTDVADVLDLTNSNPLTVAIVDGSGDQITSFGGGTQYTEGDTDSSITGTATMMEGAGNTLLPIQGTIADGLLVNLGANNDITGTVTANAGTNLNTSLLALESGGNLTSIKTNTDKIPSLGQALDVASVPVVLTAAQISTLTPPAAITGYATAAAQIDKSQFTKITDGTDTALITGSGELNVLATAQPGVDIGDVTINNASGASAVNIQDGGNSITVDAPVATPVFVRLSDGAAAISTLPVSLATNTPTLQAGSTTTVTQGTGTNLHTVVDSGTITTVTSVTQNADVRQAVAANLNMTEASAASILTKLTAGAASMVKLEDVASNTGDAGTPAMAIRKATPANTSDTDGDYEILQMSAGRLWTSATIDSALPAGTNGIGKLTSNSGVTIGAVEIAASQTLSTVTTVGSVTSITNALPAGTNAIGKLAANSGVDIGDVDITSVIAGTGATNLGKAEDAGHTTGDTGVMILGVSNEAGTALVNANIDYTPIATDKMGQIYINPENNKVLFRGMAGSFRTLGRAGTAGQKILAIHNATGSSITVKINRIVVDMWCTVVKAITVAPPIVRIWKFTAVPTNGTNITKSKIGGTTTSNASCTVWNDASADGTGSATTLTVTLPAGTIIDQKVAPRVITAAGGVSGSSLVFEYPNGIQLAALEGVCVFLDYTAATSNPTTDMWFASVLWEEFTT